MGFFSWKCAVSGESVANIYSGMDISQSDCVLITPNKVYFEPSYEGYGEFGGVDVYDLLGDGDRNKGIDDYFNGNPKHDIKVVLSKHYEKDKHTYDSLKASETCEYQGYFYPQLFEEDWSL